MIGVVGLADVESTAIGVGVDDDGLDAHLAAGADHADGDLAAVGDQDFLEQPGRHNCVAPEESAIVAQRAGRARRTDLTGSCDSETQKPPAMGRLLCVAERAYFGWSVVMTPVGAAFSAFAFLVAMVLSTHWFAVAMSAC